ncbi:hypothetical protein JL2886_01411 [Phaeobacter gallaeciensis]|uniref:Uncharacterized protein n=1 Tax=Phaeobacter gallaeciensis TaxID=60890 RepID=A0A1B0ZQ76_9RHOB|nr:hypothetical protein JL2886_01411 [Phaeobacter gallaeciensis]
MLPQQPLKARPDGPASPSLGIRLPGQSAKKAAPEGRLS